MSISDILSLNTISLKLTFISLILVDVKYTLFITTNSKYKN